VWLDLGGRQGGRSEHLVPWGHIGGRQQRGARAVLAHLGMPVDTTPAHRLLAEVPGAAREEAVVLADAPDVVDRKHSHHHQVRYAPLLTLVAALNGAISILCTPHQTQERIGDNPTPITALYNRLELTGWLPGSAAPCTPYKGLSYLNS
jgi:hypothetical protein